MLDQTIEFPDQREGAENAPPLRLRVQEDSHGIQVTVLNDHDESMAYVIMDYFDNKLQAIYADPEQTEDPEVVSLVSDVEATRKVRQQEEICREQVVESLKTLGFTEVSNLETK